MARTKTAETHRTTHTINTQNTKTQQTFRKKLFLCPRRVTYSDWLVRPSVRVSVRLSLFCPEQNYARHQHEISYAGRSHWGEVQCTITITLGIIFLELLLFVDFHNWIFHIGIISTTVSQNMLAMEYNFNYCRRQLPF